MGSRTSLTSTIPFRDYTGPGLKAFIDAYNKKYGTSRLPNSEVALNYMTMHLFAEAIAKANSTDPVAVMAKIPDAAKSLPGKFQPAKINGVSKAGHLLIDALAASVDKGKYVPVKVPFTE